ncbi:MAG: transposase [Desulfobacteraceae bacterium]|nr:transposase [Desulfobacteraceae bacterium]
MPRKARVVLPNCAHHVVQRGHNRQAVFVEDRDYQHYLDTLIEWKLVLGIKVYAYCLMTNHVHLVIDPGDEPDNLGILMKRLAGRQTRMVNILERRTGSLWEGRYKSSPIQTDNYLLACCRYVELNPVRANMVSRPEEYHWSSYRFKTGLENDWLDLDPCYLGLGENAQQRQERYQRWVDDAIPEDEWKLIRDAVQRGQLTGNQGFVEEVEKKVGIRVELRGRGRPAVAEK